MKEISEGDPFDAESVDIEEFLALIEDMTEKLDGLPAFFYEKDEDDDEDDDYDSGSLSDEMKRYHREFRKYIEKIKSGLEKLGYKIEGNEESPRGIYGRPQENNEAVENADTEGTNPFERGHKWGCGCSGCTGFRENFYSSDMSLEDLTIPDTLMLEEVRSQVEKYTDKHEDNPEDYPCGGKLRGSFQNRDSFLKYTLMDIDKRQGIMNYLAA